MLQAVLTLTGSGRHLSDDSFVAPIITLIQPIQMQQLPIIQLPNGQQSNGGQQQLSKDQSNGGQQQLPRDQHSNGELCWQSKVDGSNLMQSNEQSDSSGWYRSV